jgi:hypothetical protein
MIRPRPIFLLRPNPLQLLGGGLLLWQLDRAVKHQRTCQDCEGRDFLAIAFDIPHLWKAPRESEGTAASEEASEAGAGGAGEATG